MISADKLNTPITREEMAILITKVLGKEEEVKNKDFIVLPFDDTKSISTNAKPYVEYVYNESIMKGLTNNKFSPKEYVTRAQVAIILNSIISKVDIVPEIEKEVVDDTKANITLSKGTVTSVDTVLMTIEIDDENIYEYDEDTLIYLNGTKVDISKVKVESKITSAKIKNGIITEIRLGEEKIKEDKKADEEYITGEVIDVTSKKVVIELSNGEEVTLYPADESQVIDSEDAQTIKLRKLEEGDSVIAVGEWDDEDYYFTVLIKLAR